MNDARRYRDIALETALNKNQGFSIVNKFGKAPSGVQASATDIWDRADATPTQQIWVAPTQARVHAIVSTSAEDGAGTATGALTIRVYGLTDWDTAETSEVVTMAGLTPVNTSASYVIIHRMKVVTAGSAAGAVGNISATAATDSSVTATIRAGQNQTTMAIYGVPSTQSLLMCGYTASMGRATAAATVGVDVSLLVCEDPETDIDLFLVKDTDSVFGAGTSALVRSYCLPKMIDGPAIIKFQAFSTLADTDLAVSFDGLLVTL